ncbi:hypothetical protein BJX66DRAFT_313015 [Aspergillus keveii]|uniref:Transcription factor domain-containing protein n=1 Tax=Aspergillus keveii TaxID=714993 RepID=A0ABR4FSQ2_9EURO
MFASAGSVPLPCLVKAGFQSRLEARTVFAGKVKALYNVGFETDHISLLQGLLILAYWQDFRSCPKQFSHWVNVSWSLLQGMVASEECDTPQPTDSQIPYRVYGQSRIPIRLYRRMYWSWQDSFSALAREHPGASSTIAPVGSQPAMVLRQSIPVIILYTALSSLLSRQTILLDTATSDGPELDLYKVRKQIQDRRFFATSTVTETFIRLKAHGFLHALPPCIMALLLPATVAQFTRVIADPDPFAQTLNEQYLTDALGVLCEMGDATPCARRWVEVFVDMFGSHEGRRRQRGWFLCG